MVMMAETKMNAPKWVVLAALVPSAAVVTPAPEEGLGVGEEEAPVVEEGEDEVDVPTPPMRMGAPVLPPVDDGIGSPATRVAVMLTSAWLI